MEVTDVRLRRVNTEGRMRAIASITLDQEFRLILVLVEKSKMLY